MIRVFFICLFVFSSMTWAGVYRWVDSSGEVHFSDRPTENAEPLKIQPGPSQDSSATARNTQGGDPATAAKESANTGFYESFEIVSPTQNQTMEQTTGDVPVSLLIDPALDSEHQLAILLDGSKTVVESGSTQFRLTNVSFGSHQLQAQITDSDGSLIARTSSVAFHLRPPAEAR